jgi:hypothetical protein
MTACFDGACQDVVTTVGSFAGTVAAMTLGRASTGGSSYWDGHIDEFTLWNTSDAEISPITAADIATLFNNGRGLNPAHDFSVGGVTYGAGGSQLVVYHRMEENTGTSVANHGTASGTATVSASDLWTKDTI